MRHGAWLLAFTLLLGSYGCGGKDEDPANPDNNPQTSNNNPADNNPENSNPTPGGQDTPPVAKPPANTPKKPAVNEPVVVIDDAVLKYVPQETAILLTMKPGPLMASEFYNGMPQDMRGELDQNVMMVAENVGIDVASARKVAVAVWPGESHMNKVLQGLQPPPLPPESARPFDDFDAKAPAESKAAPDDCAVQEFGEDEKGGFDKRDFDEPDFDGPPGPEVPEMDFAMVLDFGLAPDWKAVEAFVEGNGLSVEKKTVGSSQQWFVSREGSNAPRLVVHAVTDQLVIIAAEPSLATVTGSDGTAPILQKAAKNGLDHTLHLQVDLSDVRDDIKDWLAMLENAPLPPLIANPVRNFGKELNGLAFIADVQQQADMKLLVDFDTAKAAQSISSLANVGKGMIQFQVQADSANATTNYGPELGKEYTDMVSAIFNSATSTADGNQVVISFTIPANAPVVMGKVGTLMNKRMKPRNDMKQILIACHIYHEQYAQFPNNASPANKENVGLSWRVHILPLIDQSPLYEQFKLDEPWDSEHNKALMAQMPDVYKVSDDAKPGHTQVLMVSGKEFLLDGATKRSFRNVTDGASNTIGFVTVAAEHAVPWTKPADLDAADVAAALKKLGGSTPGQFFAGFVDGSVRGLETEMMYAELLKKYFTIGGGEVINVRWLDAEADDHFGGPGDFKDEPDEDPAFDGSSPAAKAVEFDKAEAVEDKK